MFNTNTRVEFGYGLAMSCCAYILRYVMAHSHSFPLSRFQFIFITPPSYIKQLLPLDLFTVFSSAFLCSLFCMCAFFPWAWSQVRQSKGHLLGLMSWFLLGASHFGESGLLAGAAFVARAQGMQCQKGQAVLDVLQALEKADSRVGWKVHFYLLWGEIYMEKLTAKLCPA